MSTDRSPRLAAAALLLAPFLVLAGCATIPADGETGLIEVEEPTDGVRAEIEPDGPAEGDAPNDIVRGFLAAGAGYADDFGVARSFLTDDFANEWDPQAGVTIMPPEAGFDSFTAEVSSDQQEISLTLPVDATLDSQHVYRQHRAGADVEREFSLRQVNGEWRISQAPQGLVLTASSFGTVFDSYSLYFYTHGFDYLVPDTRWFVRSTATSTEIMSALLAGPADHLGGAVVSAIPDGTRMEPRSVTVEGGTAEVGLDASVQALDDEDAGRVVTQISATLRGLSSTNAVVVTSPAGELLSPAGDVPPVGVQTDQRPVLVSDGGLVRLSGTRLEPIDGLPEPADGVRYPAVSFDEAMYAYLADDGTQLHKVLPDSDEDAVMLTDQDGLTAPSIDRFDNIWTGSSQGTGDVRVVRPSGEVVDLPVQWLSGRDILTLAVSRDGTQLAVLSEDESGAARIDVAGIIRGADGEPTATADSTPLRVGAGFEEIVDISWAGSTQLAVLGAETSGSAPQPHLTGVGGPSSDLGEVEGGVAITASSDATSIRVTTEEGDLYSFGSDTWQRLVDLVAYDPAYPG